MSKILDVIINYVEQGNADALRKLNESQNKAVEATKKQIVETTKLNKEQLTQEKHVKDLTSRNTQLENQLRKSNTELNNMRNRLRDVNRESNNTNRGLGDLIKNVGVLTAGYISLRGSISLIGSSSANAGIIQASRNIGTQISLIKDLGKAYQDTLDKTQLYQIASQAALRGVSGERLTRTATLATQLADAGYLGGDAVALTDQITSALETGRIRGLAPYIVDFQKLNDKVKDGVISQEQLLSILEKNAARFGDINADDAGDQLDRINAQFRDMQQYAGEQLGALLTPLLKQIGDLAVAWNNLPDGVKNIFLGGAAVIGGGALVTASGGALGQFLTFLKNGWAELGVVALTTNKILESSNPILDEINIKIKTQQDFLFDLENAYRSGIDIKESDLDFERQRLESYELTKEAILKNGKALDDVAEKAGFLSGNIGKVHIPAWGQWAIGITAVVTSLLNVHNWLSALSDGQWNINVIWPNMPEWLRGLTSGNQSYGMGPTRADANRSLTPSREVLTARATALQLDIPTRWNPLKPFEKSYTYNDEQLLAAINREETKLGIPLTGFKPSTQLGGEWKDLYVKSTTNTSATPKSTGGSSTVSAYGTDQPGDLRNTLASLYEIYDVLFGDKAAERRFKFYNTPDQYKIDLHNKAAKIRNAQLGKPNQLVEGTLKPLAKVYDILFGSGAAERAQQNAQDVYAYNTSLIGTRGQDRINKLLEADPKVLGEAEARHKHNVARKMQARNAAMQLGANAAIAGIQGGAGAAATSAIQEGLALVAANNPAFAIPLSIISSFVPDLFKPHQRKTIPKPTDVRLINPEDITGPINSAIQQFMRLNARGVAAGGRQFLDHKLSLQTAGLRGI